MKKIGMMFFIITAVLMCLVGCNNIVDGTGMINTDYEQGY